MAKQSEKTKSSAAEFDFRTIKSFEDACKKMNVDPTELPVVPKCREDLKKRIISDYKLCIVFEAINNGWTPDWTNWNQYKYYPWFEVKATKALSSGFGFSHSDYRYTRATTAVGSRLCTDTSDKAKYIAKQFEQEYQDFLLITK
ncbi:MAG: hypothetical protein ACOYM0_01170 [Bacteroidales bacterium]